MGRSFQETQAIRPHVLGRFGDMLKAVEQHIRRVLSSTIENHARACRAEPARLGNLAREIMPFYPRVEAYSWTTSPLARIIAGPLPAAEQLGRARQF